MELELPWGLGRWVCLRRGLRCHSHTVRTVCLISRSLIRNKPWRQDIDSTAHRLGMPFLQRCRLGVLQFVPMQILCTTLCYVLTYKKMYQEGVWINPKEEDLPSHGFLVFGLGYGRFTPFGYVNLLRILSCTIALYCLVYFYRGTRKLLGDIDPYVKCLSIKTVVFATF